MASEILVVTSKVKAYIAKEEMRTSGDVAEELSAHIATVLDDAIAFAKKAGRQTVKAVDVTAAVDALSTGIDDE